MNNQLTILNRIRVLRQQLGYSQEYMAEILGISQQTYSNIEKHPGKLTINRLIDISAILRVDYMSFLSEETDQGTDDSTAPKTVEDLKASIAMYERLIQELKEEITFLRSIVKQ